MKKSFRKLLSILLAAACLGGIFSRDTGSRGRVSAVSDVCGI
jgi:hypothetical protein